MLYAMILLSLAALGLGWWQRHTVSRCKALATFVNDQVGMLCDRQSFFDRMLEANRTRVDNLSDDIRSCLRGHRDELDQLKADYADVTARLESVASELANDLRSDLDKWQQATANDLRTLAAELEALRVDMQASPRLDGVTGDKPGEDEDERKERARKTPVRNLWNM